jgi:hypothetical protein
LRIERFLSPLDLVRVLVERRRTGVESVLPRRDSLGVSDERRRAAVELGIATREVGVAIAGRTLLSAELVVKPSESRERVVYLSREGVEQAAEASVVAGGRRAEL